MVKYLQRLARSLESIELCRLQLLTLYLEKCMIPFAAHIAIVANNRGLDLQNLSNFESNQLRAQSHLVKNFRLIAAMHTPEFHALLRRHVSKLSDYQRDFIVTNKLWQERTDIRKKLLQKLLTKKRKQFLKELMKPAPMTYTIPQFDLEEIQAFISGGPDPLIPRLQVFESKHQEWYEEKHRPKTPFRCKDASQRHAFIQPRFYLLTELVPGDLIFFFSEFSSILREEKRQQLAAARSAALASLEQSSGVSSSVLRTFSNDRGEDANEYDIREIKTSFAPPSANRSTSRRNPRSHGGGQDLGSSSINLNQSNHAHFADSASGGGSFMGRSNAGTYDVSMSGSFRLSSSSSANHARHSRRSSTQQGGGHFPADSSSSSSSFRRASTALHQSALGLDASVKFGQSSSARPSFAAQPPPSDRRKSVLPQQSHRKISNV